MSMQKHWQKDYRNMNSKESTNYNYILGTYQKIKIQEKFVKLQEM